MIQWVLQSCGYDVYSYPLKWTSIKPEFKPYYWPVWSGEEWKQVENHMGQTVWKSYDESMVINTLGPIPEGYSLERPAKKYTQAEKIKMYEDAVQGYLDYTAQQKRI